VNRTRVVRFMAIALYQDFLLQVLLFDTPREKWGPLYQCADRIIKNRILLETGNPFISHHCRFLQKHLK